MGDRLWVWNRRSDRLLGSLSRFGERIVTRVKVLSLLEGAARVRASDEYLSETSLLAGRISQSTHLELVAYHVLAIGQLAVQTKQFLLLLAQRLKASIHSRDCGERTVDRTKESVCVSVGPGYSFPSGCGRNYSFPSGCGRKLEERTHVDVDLVALGWNHCVKERGEVGWR